MIVQSRVIERAYFGELPQVYSDEKPPLSSPDSIVDQIIWPKRPVTVDLPNQKFYCCFVLLQLSSG